MCGIAGLIDLRAQRPADRAVIGRMADAILHRGPDEFGLFQTQGMDPAWSSAEDFRHLVARDAERWAGVVSTASRSAGLGPQAAANASASRIVRGRITLRNRA